MSEDPIEVHEAEEVVDGLPVVADVRAIEVQPAPVSLPAVQAAAAAMTGFVAGAATLAVMRRRQARRLARRMAPRFDPTGAGTRTYLVHVYRVARPPAAHPPGRPEE